MPNDAKNHSKIPDAQLELDQVGALVSKPKTAAGGLSRITVRIIGFRVHLLDPDNFAGGCKDIIDGLRHAGLLPEDTHRAIKLETDQEKVAKFREEKTEIEILYPEGGGPKPDALGRQLTF